jgi:2-oxoisovalerate dehydrogenase E1 component alpha subunit
MDLTPEQLLEMYWYMLLARRLDELAWKLHRQGEISFHISGIGHEALQAGAALAIKPQYDWVAPYYRDLTLMLALGLTPGEFLSGLMAKEGSPDSNGRDIPAHWSLKRANVISHSPVAAAQATQAVGVALGIKLSGEPKVILHCLGEGATAAGPWYEAVNWAAVQKMPVVFLVENNHYALSLPLEMQMAAKSVAEKMAGLGLPTVSVDGTDFIAVHRAVKRAVDRARQGGGPGLVEAITYRPTPHSSDDDDRSYRSRKEVEEHQLRDPLILTRVFLQDQDILTPHKQVEMDKLVNAALSQAMDQARSAPEPSPQDIHSSVYDPGERACL